jgi:hypothetical protein
MRVVSITIALHMVLSVAVSALSPHFALPKPQVSRRTWRLSTVPLDRTEVRHDRFDRAATHVAQVDQSCIRAIKGIRYNVTAWAKTHPGGTFRRSNHLVGNTLRLKRMRGKVQEKDPNCCVSTLQ